MGAAAADCVPVTAAASPEVADPTAAAAEPAVAAADEPATVADPPAAAAVAAPLPVAVADPLVGAAAEPPAVAAADPPAAAAAYADPPAVAAADPPAAVAARPYPHLAFADHEAFTAALLSLSDDPLAATGTRLVPARGPPDARLMIVGEAPGAAEDAAGAPFVGPSGQLLDAILAAAGLNPAADVYVTNVVKRRPPGNRDPSAAEVAWYRPWLVEEVRLVAPTVVMVLGRVAARAVTGDTRPLGTVRGVWRRWEEGDGAGGVWVLPAFHPSYLLRNPSAAVGGPKALMWDDIREVVRVLKGGHVEEGRTYQGPGVP